MTIRDSLAKRQRILASARLGIDMVCVWSGFLCRDCAKHLPARELPLELYAQDMPIRQVPRLCRSCAEHRGMFRF